MILSFEAPYYKIVQRETLKSIEVYWQFLNWTIGEFDLNLIEESNGLIVHFPNGLFSVNQLNNVDDKIRFEICVKSKSKKAAINIFQKIELLYNQLNRT